MEVSRLYAFYYLRMITKDEKQRVVGCRLARLLFTPTRTRYPYTAYHFQRLTRNNTLPTLMRRNQRKDFDDIGKYALVDGTRLMDERAWVQRNAP